MIDMRHRKAFTLIELLVVVAIIAVLVALLLPALQSARENAKAAACMANMKSQANAVMMYEMDWGVYPPVFWGDSVNWPYDCTSWAQFIYGYLHGTAKVKIMTTLAWDEIRQVARSKLYVCPSAREPGYAIGAGPGEGIHYAYSDLNHQIPSDGQIRNTAIWLRPGTFTRDPGAIRMLCDAKGYFTHYCPLCSPDGWLYYDTPEFGRHGAGLNVGFWDGHVQFKTDAGVSRNLEMHGHNGL